MLREITDVRQIEGEPLRRWFHDEYFDLIVWSDDGKTIAGFQLCYNKIDDPHALTWYAESGYVHNRVDDGEGRPGKYKAAPILVDDGQFKKSDVTALFRRASRNMDSQIARFVYDKLIGHAKEKKP